MENEKNKNPQACYTAARPETAEAVTKAAKSDKKLYVVIGIILCLLIAFSMMLPSIIRYIFTHNSSIQAMMEDPITALINRVEKMDGFDEKSAEGLIASIDKAVQEIKLREPALIAALPQDIRNMQFANAKEKAEFYNDLLASYNKTTGSKELAQQMFEEKEAVRVLAFLYNYDENIARVKAKLAEAKARPQTK